MEEQIYRKLNKIEKEINSLKVFMALAAHKKIKKKTSLKGILSGVEITDGEIAESKQIIFRI